MMQWFQNVRLHINCFVTTSELKLTQKDKRIIKAREAQIHNNQGITTPSHISRFVDHKFLHHLPQGCK